MYQSVKSAPRFGLESGVFFFQLLLLIGLFGSPGSMPELQAPVSLEVRLAASLVWLSLLALSLFQPPVLRLAGLGARAVLGIASLRAYPQAALLLLPLGPELYQTYVMGQSRRKIHNPADRTAESTGAGQLKPMQAVALVSLPALWALDAVWRLPGIACWLFCAWLAYTSAEVSRDRTDIRTALGSLGRDAAKNARRIHELEHAASEKEQLARFHERQRLASSLHDQLGHTITGTIMQLEATRTLLTDNPERSALLLDKSVLTLRDGLSRIRQSLREIKPQAAEYGRSELAALLSGFEADHRVTTFFQPTGSLDGISATQWLVIMENLREALTNLLRHSDATEFRCLIGELNRLYRVDFRDNGRPKARPVFGLGLEGMRERTVAAGGTLLVDASRGFCLTMLFPKKGDSA